MSDTAQQEVVPRRLPGTRCRAMDCSAKSSLRWDTFAFWCAEHGPGDEWTPDE